MKMLNKVNTPSRHSMRNAWDHIDKARALIVVDPSMAAFRAITAEEEAATALIKLVTERQYEGSKLLNRKMHDHKNCVYFFIVAIAKHFKALTDLASIQTLVTGLTEEKLRIKWRIEGLLPQGMGFEPPLPLDLRINQNNEEYDLANEITEVIQESEHSSLKKLINEESNLRNKILYANDSGIPSVNAPHTMVDTRESRVRTMTYIYLLIAQHKERQQLVAMGCKVMANLTKMLKQK